MGGQGSHTDNHYLDCEVYATAAADILGVRSMHLMEEERAEQKTQRQDNNETAEESWIRTNDGWI